MDLKLLLLRLRQATPKAITISPNHIKGHQDKSKNFEYESAPQSVHRNIDMDELAGKFLEKDQHQLEPSSHQLGIPGQAASLFINHQPINNNMHHHINLYYFGPKLESRFRSKNTIPSKSHSIFHWKAMERAFRATSERDKLSRFNLIHKKWVTNMVQAGWDGDKTPMCQLCTDREETVIHIFACPSTSTTSAYSKAVQKFKQSLQQCNTAPVITTAFTIIISRVRKGYDVPLPQNKLHTEEINELVEKTFQHQLEISPEFFLRGYVSKQWDVIQNLY